MKEGVGVGQDMGNTFGSRQAWVRTWVTLLVQDIGNTFWFLVNTFLHL